ncbi:hypothetical protein [Sphingobacterium gobiense]|uniref:Uncharacterized protein n=1 Tax=Sphingobacterium gobiense TaxID=1382456 RepID=A0A2S9JS92_9SPHI|nr:hypothetical protein [Sphingobacterium gobiense]PRD56114.1 hypothetical protein C5749_02215 [Sphingobacterium gobiense]
MKAITKREHETLQAKLMQVARDAESPETRHTAEEALLALQEQYQAYHEMIEQLKTCIMEYRELQKSLRSDILVPALREERKATKYSVRDFQLMVTK